MVAAVGGEPVHDHDRGGRRGHSAKVGREPAAISGFEDNGF
jgi:hypothetical protein